VPDVVCRNPIDIDVGLSDLHVKRFAARAKGGEE
jgi:hypothetical protein